jgi:hypothetical protein
MTASYVISRSAMKPAPPIVLKTSPGDITIVLPPSPLPAGYEAVLNVALSNNDTATVPPGWYYHEAMIELTDGSVVTVMNGILRLDPTYLASKE